MNLDILKQKDPKIAELIEAEYFRQQNTIELIASENFTSPAVMQACGSVLTNKYAEGTPFKRFYNGCENVDLIESIAQERAKQLFGAQHANLQPHSGAQANMAVFLYALKPGDTVLGMDLAAGGHLTHGSAVNFSGLYFNTIGYGVDENGVLDYDEILKLARQHKPKLIIAGASNYSKIIDFERFAKIAKEVDALLLVDMAHIAGLVAGKVHPSPFPWADFVTTTTHKTLRGPRGGIVMCKEEHAKGIDKAVFPGTQGGPLEHIIAAKAVALKEAMSEDFQKYAQNVVKNAKALCASLIEEGVDILGAMTENHLMTIDLRKVNKTGKDVANMLEKIAITANKNSVPNDPQSPFITSGVRLGTAAVTSRGFDEHDMTELGKIIASAISIDEGDENSIANLKERSKKLLAKHPLIY